MKKICTVSVLILIVFTFMNSESFIMEDLVKLDMQFVLLGTGDASYNDIFKRLGKKYRGKFGINILFDPKMAKRIYAGSDIFVMPSRYEPCGLGQLIAMR